LGNNSVNIIEEKKNYSISLNSEWFERLLYLTKRDRQSSAAAMVRYMIMDREDQLGISRGDLQ